MMSRKQRIRICANLQKLIETAPTIKVRDMYIQQYRNTAARIKGNQPTGVGAGRLNTNIANSITVILAQQGGIRNECVS